MTTLSDLQRMEVVDRDGRRLGHVFDVVVAAGEPGSKPRLVGYLIGRGGLARRLGIRRGTARRIDVDDVESVHDRKIVVAAGIRER